MVRKKGFYSISAVAKMFSIHQQTIRLYEKEGLVTPKRSEGNTRLFSDEDIDRLEEIIYLTHQLGVNLAGVEMILKLENKINKMQKKMNALFDKTSEELKQEKDIAKNSISSSVRSLMQLKNEANGTGKQEKRAQNFNNTSDAQKVKKPSKTSTGKSANTFDAEVDNWEIEYDE
jgi:MerR family transcriptional regulator, heat shock protein HspR